MKMRSDAHEMLDGLAGELKIDIGLIGDPLGVVGPVDQRDHLQKPLCKHMAKEKEEKRRTRPMVMSQSRQRNCCRSISGTGTDSSYTVGGSSKIGNSFTLTAFSRAAARQREKGGQRRRKRAH